MAKPVSIIIPTYNRAGSILQSVESVLQQDYEDFEIVVVDDASTDHTAEVLSGITDSRMRYHRMQTNSGASAARNEGVRLAANEMIAFQDSDDLWRPEKLTVTMDHYDKHPDDVLLYAPFQITLPDKTTKRFPDRLPLEELSGNIFQYLLCRNTISPTSLLTTKEIFDKAGGFDESMPALEDWDLAIRISRLGCIGYIDQILVDVTASEGGLSSSVTKYFDARCRMIAKYRNEMSRLNLFDHIVTDVFRRAEKEGILEQVKKMLMLHLTDDALQT